MENSLDLLEKSFEQKLEYFSRLGLEIREVLRLHETPGLLWEKESNGESWQNVTDHCLLEAVRASILAEKLNLHPRIKADLTEAAVLHDFYKKHEIVAIETDLKNGGSGRAGALKARKEAAEYLRQAGFNENIVRFANSVGGQPEELFRVEGILGQEELSEEDIAHLIMHYVDDYTRDSEWVLPVIMNGDQKINDVDRRMEKNLNNPNYKKINRKSISLHKGHPFFEGKTTFEVMGEIGHLIEKELADLIRKRSGEVIDPIYLPEVIDKEVKERIHKITEI